jgi:hypothetical protein
MPHAHTNTVDEDISSFSNTVPPPPYSVTGTTGEARPRLPEDKRNVHLSTRKPPGVYSGQRLFQCQRMLTWSSFRLSFAMARKL